MSDGEPSTKPAVVPKPRAFRWRMIPATLVGIFAVPCLLIGVCAPLFALYINLKYGWIVAYPDNPSTTFVAFNLMNLTFWQLYFWIAIVGMVSAFSWVRGRWHHAWSSAIVMCILVIVLNGSSD